MTATDLERGDDFGEAGGELVPVADRQQTPGGIAPPSRDEWNLILEQANVLAQSKIVPAKFFQKPHELVAVTLMSRELHRGLMWGLRYLWISPDGKTAMMAEGMSSLVISAGYDIWPIESTDKVARIGWSRGDRSGEVEYTIDEAIQAGLVEIREGKPYARSDQGKPLAWEKFTKDMLYARCTSRTCRRAYPHVLGGCSYVPEEIGAHVDPETGEVETSGVPTISVEKARELRSRVKELPAEAKKVIREKFIEMDVVIAMGKDTEASILVPVLPLSWLDRVEEELAKVEESIDRPPTPPVDDNEPAEGVIVGADEDPPASDGAHADAEVVPPEVANEEPGAGPATFNGDAGHCGRCGAPTWYASSARDGGPAWLHAEASDAAMCPDPALEAVGVTQDDLDALYASTHAAPDPKVRRAAITAEVATMGQTQILQSLREADLSIEGAPKALKLRWLQHRLDTEAPLPS